ncbi:hypothetical protein ASG04_16285 [Curtobacterium sp. Leaf183]|nr:hypothetical protein ASG04_16285 [Curtobacterium sp. Leaf183]
MIVKCVSSTALNEVQLSGALPSEYEPHWSLFALIRLNQNSTSRLVMGLPSDQCRSPSVIVTLVPSLAKSAAVAIDPALFHAILPVEPSYATRGSYSDCAIEPLFVLRCAAVPIGRIQFGVKLAGSA